MFGISFEHILILGVVLLIFGPKRLPDLGRSLGESIRNFKNAFNGNLEDESAKKRLTDQKPGRDPYSKPYA
jgi:sec-independent protein translocase protein TatA